MSDWVDRAVDDLPTPCLLLDYGLLVSNLRRMQGTIEARGKRLRAHAKTHKCSKLAALQLQHGAAGICAAKVSEARGLIAAGINGVLLTSPASTRWTHNQVLECATADAGFIATLDSIENAKCLSDLFLANGRRLRCLLDLDPYFGRTGVPPAEFPNFAKAVGHLAGIEILGMQAYAGHVQHIHDFSERRNANQQCLDVASEMLRFLRESGLAQPILSVGGTGSHMFDIEHPDVTEIQAGSYALMDAEYSPVSPEPGSLRFDTFSPALMLKTTVVSANQSGFVTVDAGLKALYRDGATPQVVKPSLRYDWFGDEFGKVSSAGASLPKLGEKLSLVVSHCDPTVNLFDQFFVTQGDRVVDVWPIDLRGCSQ